MHYFHCQKLPHIIKIKKLDLECWLDERDVQMTIQDIIYDYGFVRTLKEIRRIQENNKERDKIERIRLKRTKRKEPDMQEILQLMEKIIW